MKTIKKQITIPYTSTKAYSMYFNGYPICSFDIETTGLSPDSATIILSGLYMHYKDHGEVIQFFAETEQDETLIIEETLKLLNQSSHILTYNGRSFDIPFLLKRAVFHGLDIPDIPYNLDLYSLFDKFSKIRDSINNLSQKNAEIYAGITNLRTDKINGQISIKLYSEYIRQPSERSIDKILLHNRDDVLQLFRLLRLLPECDLHKAMANLGFSCYGYHVIKQKIIRSSLSVKLKLPPYTPNYISFPTLEAPYRVMFTKQIGEIDFTAERIDENILVVDAHKILTRLGIKSDDIIFSYPGFQSGYLILKDNKHINQLEINAFIIRFLSIFTF